MIEMSEEGSLHYLIVDSTAIIHQFVLENKLNDNEFLIVPERLLRELKSFESKSILSLLEAEGKLSQATPSSAALEKIIEISKKSGDYGSLSQTDLQVLALALDYPDSIIYSDDNAIQNVSVFLGIQVISQHFKIKQKREYFWKCTVCGSKYSQKVEVCLDCGSPVKRFFKRK